MRICLIAVEIFAWGKYGGFGRATRLIGKELARRGHEVFAVVPRRSGQAPVEQLDGMTVLGFSPWQPWRAAELFQQCDADVYHSCEPSLATYAAMQAMPKKRHIVTFRDPRTFADWRLEFDRPSLSRLQVLHNYSYENNWLVHRAISRMDAVYTIGRYLIPKVASMYQLRAAPRFLPTPVPLPAHVEKAATPTVCYVARLDRRKRPQLFFDLVKQFPRVTFVVAGRSRDPQWEAKLREQYGAQPNLELLGFVDQFSDPRHAETLSRSWVLVNTATREALPNSFIEAMAHRCAILSGVNPDGFAARFGRHVQDDDFAGGLGWLLADNRWRACGEQAAEEIRATFELERAMDLHEAAYAEALARPSGSRAGLSWLRQPETADAL
jgi:glycosyltransferase involved in cell wall biosynthesis